ncbi:DNA cytosine methyltransferase [Staphylococcus casei]|uniref:Cytosine-specific methyltransferase n=1 Tax=Staphylococcus casei TaxID=201828 RepID=A0ABZ2W7L8_9STAP
MNKIAILDLFCGTGGFSSGFVKYNNDFEVVAGVDMLESSLKTFQLNHPDALCFKGDIREIDPTHVEHELQKVNKTVDVIVGGPPCQGFSSIRPFRTTNINDERNTLFEQFAKYVFYFQPKSFIMENVVGLATHNKGKTISTIEKVFRDLGYSIDWKILNAANYGVPQKRERLIMIGYRDGQKVLFPKPTHSFKGKTIGIRDKERKIPTFYEDLPNAISVMDAISDLPLLESGQTAEEYISPPLTDFQKERRRFSDKYLSMHTATVHSPKMLEIISYSGSSIKSIPSHLINSGFSSSYSRLAANEPSNTLTVNFVHPASNRCIHPYQNRALTPREGARLQSFDDNFKFYGSRTQIVKQIGNAVPPLLGFAIAKVIYEAVNIKNNQLSLFDDFR